MTCLNFDEICQVNINVFFLNKIFYKTTSCYFRNQVVDGFEFTDIEHQVNPWPRDRICTCSFNYGANKSNHHYRQRNPVLGLVRRLAQERKQITKVQFVGQGGWSTMAIMTWTGPTSPSKHPVSSITGP
jgi:hypothetical protein